MTKTKAVQRPKTRSNAAYEAIMRSGAGRHKSETDYDRKRDKARLRDLDYEEDDWDLE